MFFLGGSHTFYYFEMPVPTPLSLVDPGRGSSHGGGVEDGEWICASRNQIIPFEQRCDDELDCRDGSDEVGCWNRGRQIRGNLYC